MSRFKTVWKRFWPLLTFGLLLLALAVGLLVWHFRSTPERAVEGYLRASLEKDADGLLRYASDYQLTVLKGNTDMDLDDLREMLRRLYERPEAYRETGQIRFQSEVDEPIEPGQEKFDELLTEYGYKADPTEVEAFALVTAHCYIDGRLSQTSFVYAVRCDGKWYYGFTA